MKLTCIYIFIFSFLNIPVKTLDSVCISKTNQQIHSSYFQESNEWELQKDEEGIRIYSRRLPGTKLRQRKGIAVLKTTLGGAVSLIKDSEVATEWLDRLKDFRTLNNISEKEWYTYSEIEIPWPFDDRDIITRNTIKQDPATKAVTITLVSFPDYIPEQAGKVRIRNSEGSWTFRPLQNNKVEVTYLMWSEPGPIVLPPAFITPIIVKSIYTTVKNMKRLVESEKYSKRVLPYISN